MGTRMLGASRLIPVVVLVVCLLVAAGCSSDDPIGYSAEDSVGARAHATMVAPDGSTVGSVSFQQGVTGVLINIDVIGAGAGPRMAIHLHEVGACTPDFKAAGGHINPGEGVHGLLNAERKRESAKTTATCPISTPPLTARRERSSSRRW